MAHKWSREENLIVKNNASLNDQTIKEKFFSTVKEITIAAIANKKSRLKRVEIEFARQQRKKCTDQK